MSGIYKKTITLEIDYVKCDKCGHESSYNGIIDSWAFYEGEYYCMSCQEKHRIGFFEGNKETFK